MSVEWRLSVDCVQIAVAWAHTKAAFCANADGVGNGRRRRRRRCCCCCPQQQWDRQTEQLDSLATRIVGHKAKPSQVKSESKQADNARGANSPLKEIKRVNPYTQPAEEGRQGQGVCCERGRGVPRPGLSCAQFPTHHVISHASSQTLRTNKT